MPEDISKLEDELLEIRNNPNRLGAADLSDIVRRTERATNLQIHIADNVTPYEAALALDNILTQKRGKTGQIITRTLPGDIEHVVIAHGHGDPAIPGNWRLDRSEQPVEAFMRERGIPAGKDVFCIVCSNGEKENFARATGKLVKAPAQTGIPPAHTPMAGRSPAAAPAERHHATPDAAHTNGAHPHVDPIAANPAAAGNGQEINNTPGHEGNGHASHEGVTARRQRPAIIPDEVIPNGIDDVKAHYRSALKDPVTGHGGAPDEQTHVRGNRETGTDIERYKNPGELARRGNEIEKYNAPGEPVLQTAGSGRGKGGGGGRARGGAFMPGATAQIKQSFIDPLVALKTLEALWEAGEGNQEKAWQHTKEAASIGAVNLAVGTSVAGIAKAAGTTLGPEVAPIAGTAAGGIIGEAFVIHSAANKETWGGTVAEATTGTAQVGTMVLAGAGTIAAGGGISPVGLAIILGDAVRFTGHIAATAVGSEHPDPALIQRLYMMEEKWLCDGYIDKAQSVKYEKLRQEIEYGPPASLAIADKYKRDYPETNVTGTHLEDHYRAYGKSIREAGPLTRFLSSYDNELENLRSYFNKLGRYQDAAEIRIAGTQQYMAQRDQLASMMRSQGMNIDGKDPNTALPTFSIPPEIQKPPEIDAIKYPHLAAFAAKLEAEKPSSTFRELYDRIRESTLDTRSIFSFIGHSKEHEARFKEFQAFTTEKYIPYQDALIRNHDTLLQNERKLQAYEDSSREWMKGKSLELLKQTAKELGMEKNPDYMKALKAHEQNPTAENFQKLVTIIQPEAEKQHAQRIAAAEKPEPAMDDAQRNKAVGDALSKLTDDIYGLGKIPLPGIGGGIALPSIKIVMDQLQKDPKAQALQKQMNALEKQQKEHPTEAGAAALQETTRQFAAVVAGHVSNFPEVKIDGNFPASGGGARFDNEHLEARREAVGDLESTLKDMKRVAGTAITRMIENQQSWKKDAQDLRRMEQSTPQQELKYLDAKEAFIRRQMDEINLLMAEAKAHAKPAPAAKPNVIQVSSPTPSPVRQDAPKAPEPPRDVPQPAQPRYDIAAQGVTGQYNPGFQARQGNQLLQKNPFEPQNYQYNGGHQLNRWVDLGDAQGRGIEVSGIGAAGRALIELDTRRSETVTVKAEDVFSGAHDGTGHKDRFIYTAVGGDVSAGGTLKVDFSPAMLQNLDHVENRGNNTTLIVMRDGSFLQSSRTEVTSGNQRIAAAALADPGQLTSFKQSAASSSMLAASSTRAATDGAVVGYIATQAGTKVPVQQVSSSDLRVNTSLIGTGQGVMKKNDGTDVAIQVMSDGHVYTAPPVTPSAGGGGNGGRRANFPA